MRRSAKLVILILTMLPVATVADDRALTFSHREVCELVDAALTAPWGPQDGGLADYSCVQQNAMEGPRLQVDVVVESATGRETRPLRPGETCGRYQQYRHRKKAERVIFVSVSLIRMSQESVRFRAGLGGIAYNEQGKEDGTIGIGCGAGNEGILTRKAGRWTGSRPTRR